MSSKNTQLLNYILIIIGPILTVNSHSYCTSTYGREICSFLPAPPGKTPNCAIPGLTYCEHPKHYPGDRIQYLIQKWRLDHTKILIDESKEEFTSYFYPKPAHKYGPPNYYPDPIYIPKPTYLFEQSSNNGKTYIPPPPPLSHNHTRFHGRFENYKYSNDIPPNSPRYVYGPPNQGLNVPHVTPLKIWNRKDEALGTKLRKKRFAIAKNGTSLRTKRQSAITGSTLCEARTQFIMPRAALNDKGNWMYVVNMPELDNRYSQLVKSETCASQTCSGLCSLPAGYASRCEQKYVQKRLVALEGSGSELYSDIFWFPSCCVCTISNG